MKEAEGKKSVPPLNLFGSMVKGGSRNSNQFFGKCKKEKRERERLEHFFERETLNQEVSHLCCACAEELEFEPEQSPERNICELDLAKLGRDGAIA
ncbi:hypothetical protein RUM44_004797 [Polyplax serrata]|uniref:Uncharacterized protein n=1 Tax=Polyplax serrata TaxID=468196 RepID=A0ABR1B3U9_POLSC